VIIKDATAPHYISLLCEYQYSKTEVNILQGSAATCLRCDGMMQSLMITF